MTLNVWQATINDVYGNVVPASSVTVRIESSGVLAALYADEDGSTGANNPITADADGFVRFYVADGNYRIDADGGAAGTATWRNVQLGIRTGGVATAHIASSAVNYSKIQDVAATSRLLGRKSANAGPVEECTLSEALDFVGSAARGDLLYRGATGWTRLAAGTAGMFLYTGGPTGDPYWGWGSHGTIWCAGGTVSNAATLDIDLANYAWLEGLRVMLLNFVPATDDVDLQLRVSTDGGSTFDSSGYSWVLKVARDATAGVFTHRSGSDSVICLAGSPTGGESVSNTTAEGGVDCVFEIYDQTSTARYPRIKVNNSAWFGASTTDSFTASGSGHRENAQDTTDLRIMFESGNIASGKYYILGYNLG